jgi:pimeloyl-ACP methyl ester carboxylesterase
MTLPSPSTVFCLHFLGGSAREWHAVARALDGEVQCTGIDLPGFGGAAAVPGYDVAAMAEHVAGAIRAAAPAGRWFLAGHSMGAKVAAALARRITDGEEALPGLAGLVLLAGSPPSPEPMAEERRKDMLGWFRGDAASSAAEAARFIDANATRLPAADRALAEQDVLRMNPAAWRAWLDAGSKEDWSDRIGTLPLPALVLAGADDADLGPEAQRRLNLPHYARAELVVLPGAKHLLPLEAGAEVAALIRRFVAAGAAEAPAVPAGYLALIRSDRTAAKLRDGLLARALPDDPAAAPRLLGAAALAVLRAVMDRVVPQQGPGRIDLAARVEEMLATGQGDGWRFAALPGDAVAFALALHRLDHLAVDEGAAGFTVLSPARQDALLHRVAEGTLPDDLPEQGLDAAQMKMWFSDLRAAAAKLYVGHPATLARMGYSGIASGGDGPRKSGFQAFGEGVLEDWEPRTGAAGAGA